MSYTEASFAGWKGEDEVFRQTRVELGAEPDAVTIEQGIVRVSFQLDLAGHQTRLFTFVR